MKQRVVIKLGGASLDNPATLYELAIAAHGFRKRNYDVVLVHGGGPAINAKLVERGIQWKFINGQRQTTPEMMDVIEEVLGKDVNSKIVGSLSEVGLPSEGLSGARDRILFCKQGDPELMQVGQVEMVDTSPIKKVLKAGGIPVIAPIGFGERNMKYNVNADWAAAKIAVALSAKKLIFLTDQNGILGESKKLVRTADPQMIDHMIESGVIAGGMRTKVLTMMSALQAGVSQVRVVNATQASQLFATYRIGTALVANLPRTIVQEKEVVLEAAV